MNQLLAQKLDFSSKDGNLFRKELFKCFYIENKLIDLNDVNLLDRLVPEHALEPEASQIDRLVLVVDDEL